MIRDGHITAFYLFDVAEAISLDRIGGIIGQAASPAKLSPKPVTPPYVQYQQPPLSFDGSVIGIADVIGLHVRVRVYDYGIVSFALSRRFNLSWAELIALGQNLVDNSTLEAELATSCHRLVHALFIDIRELLDRTENALKFVGDIYAARMFTLVGARLGLDRWKEHVRDKLRTLDDIYHFAVEQSSIARGEFLELTIIAILVLELILFFLGIMK